MPYPVEMMKYFERYDNYENLLIKKFNAHFLWQKLPKKNNKFFVDILFQVGHLSSIFVPWYERAKLGLDGEGDKEILRAILRDEIPRDLPTHQDDRFHDLVEKIGISKNRMLNTEASPQTKRTIKQLFDLIRYPQLDYDLKILVALRIAGEILPAETYRHIVPVLAARFGIQPEESMFYYPHFKHDEKGGKGHADSFSPSLKSLIIDSRTLAIAEKSALKAFKIRLAFYNQFI